MNSAIKSLTLFAAAALVSSAASAATYYVSDCQPGAAAGCVAGDDSNTGTSANAAWRTPAFVRTKFAGLQAGDKILFAKGGVWVDASMPMLQNLRATAANPITFDSYTPSWGATAKPILQETRKGEGVFAFEDNRRPEVPDGGYVVQNLELRGGGTGGYGVWTAALVSDVTMKNLTIDGFSIGVNCSNETERHKLLQSTLTHNYNQGILWSCNNSLIEGNVFDGNGADRPVFDHSVYLSGAAAKNITMRGNRIFNNSLDDAGICQAVVVVVHGVQDGLTIEDNLIYQDAGTVQGGCWGIAIDPGYGGSEPEGFDRVVVRGNTIVNVGGIGIGCTGCRAPLIENNVLVIEKAPDMVAIQIPDRQRPSAVGADTGAIIRNNSIYFAATPKYALGISLAPQGTTTIGSNVQVVSNLIYFGPGDGFHQCFDNTNVTRSNFAAFDNNLCHHAGGNGTWSYQLSTLAAAKALGFDTNGQSVNPKLVAPPSKDNNWAMVLAPDSPAVNAGSRTLSSSVDKLAVARVLPDVGAFEYASGSTVDRVAPAAPVSLSLK